MKKTLFQTAFLLGVVLTACMCLAEEASKGTDLIPPKGKYDVRILRDTWGVPHIHGKTDADVAYGLAYANCEDDFATIQEALLLSRASMASIQGMKAVPFDYLVKLFRFQEIVNEKYETDLSPETRAVCEAYAEGCNHYAALNPKKVIPGFLPATGRDIVTGFVAKTPFFFGMVGDVQALFGDKRPQEVSTKTAAAEADPLTRGLPIGSNTFAIAPRRTPDGKTHLAVNSHQPWTGPVAWYEARLKSDEGMDIVGSVFPGAPIILHGHNRDLGWAHTVNHPDLVDIYVLETNPDNPMQYKFDGQWRDLKVETVQIKVKLIGDKSMTLDRKARYSVHGPVIRQTHGTYAVRYAGYGNIRQVEQWYRMGKARNIDEFEKAVRIRALPSFNIGYADAKGNIWYIYNALLPKRAEGYDWKKYLPGDTSETLWTEYLPFEKMPQVRNPKAGFIQNCNATPFQATIGDDNPREEDFPKSCGIEPRSYMGNRSQRLIELLGADESITEEEFYAYKYDLKYSPKSPAGDVIKEILAAPPSEDPLVRKAIEVIKEWDLSTAPDSRGTAIVVLSLEKAVRARMSGKRRGPDPMGEIKEKAQLLQDTFGRIDVPWQQVNRLVRGKVDVGLGGGPDVLHAVYGKWDNGRLVGQAGDSYILMVTWDRDGKVHSRSVHQFGSATLDESSPHYADQVPLFVAMKTKPVWFEEAELRQHLEGEYRPGEPRPKPWEASGR
ncbi:MAG: acylase [Phycisphaerae bacterium]|nr:acylase [Phycisphaerae bacterium]